jgi:hypothetical protein
VPLALNLLTAPGFAGSEVTVRCRGVPDPEPTRVRTILLVKWLLRDAVQVPTLLLPRRADHDELGAAIRFGAAFDKSAEPARLLGALNSLLVPSDQERLARAAAGRLRLR